MAQTFYFYDLETSGVKPRKDRIMQFGGQRTDLNLKPIGQPDNILIKLTDDILPEPDAILIHGITPQKSRAEGVSEAEFAHFFTQQVAVPGTIMIGFNNIRFDDEFIRYLLWRNFHDAYEWQWKDGRGRWDLLDVARMTRALRPEGIKWPFAPDGKASNRLELLSSLNKLDHSSVHDALSDVNASIAIARLIRNKQPKLFEYLLNLRDKNKVEALVNKGQPLLYSSGRYPSEFEKTTAAVMVGPHPQRKAALMYDLRVDPDEFINLSTAQLAEKWSARGKDVPYFPVKTLAYNRCPALAPLGVLDTGSAKRLDLNNSLITKNYKKLKKAKDFGQKLANALEIIYPAAQPELVIDEQRVDEQLYDGFVNEIDRTKMSVVRAAEASDLANLDLQFDDDRLKTLLPLYKARNFPATLNHDERKWWGEFKIQRLQAGGEASRASQYFKRIEELSQQSRIKKDQKYILEELKLYAQSMVPTS